MSKNLTRKGLAFGALVALGSSVIAGAPATAAETLALAPSAGTAYKVFTTSDFKLAAGFAGTESTAAAGALKYRIVNAGANTVTAAVVVGGAAGTLASKVYGTATDSTAGATDIVVYSSTGTAGIGAENSVTVSVADGTADKSLTVQAWLDIDGGNDIDPNEATSPIRTITFVDHTNVTGTVALAAPVVGADNLEATVTLDGYNYDQLDADDVAVTYYAANVAMGSTDDTANSDNTGTGTVATTAAARKNPNVAVWSASTSTLKSTFFPESTDATNADLVYNKLVNAASVTYGAKLAVLTGAGTYAVVDSSASYGSPVTGTVSALSAIAAKNGPSVTVSDSKLRAGAGSVKVETTATVPAGKSKAGHTVTFKIEENGANLLDAAATVTAGGNTLKNTSSATVQSITATAVTDADGVAAIEIAYTGLKDTNAIKITASTTGASAVVPAAQLVLTGEDSLAADVQDDVYVGKKSVVKGSSYSVNYTVVDQFGQTPDGTFRLVMSENSTDANYSSNIDVVAGKATFTVTENSNAANPYNLVATLQKKQTDGSWLAANAQTETTALDVVASAGVAANVAISVTDDGSSTALTRTTADVYTGNSNLKQESEAVPTYTGGTDVTVTVTSSTGALLVGAPVSISGPGVLFVADSIYANGSFTATTNASGQVVVAVDSNLAGKKTITVTSGSASKTATITWAAATAISGKTLSVDAPATVGAGRTLTLKGLLVDKYGNPVDTNQGAVVGTSLSPIAVSYSGPGFVSGNLPTETDADGAFQFSVLYGAVDSGTATIKVTYAGANGVIGTGDDDVTVTKTVLVGAAGVPAAATAAVAGATGAVKLTVRNAAGQGVVVTVNGKTVIARRAASAIQAFSAKTTAGKKTVVVKVAGKTVATRTVTVK